MPDSRHGQDIAPVELLPTARPASSHGTVPPGLQETWRMLCRQRWLILAVTASLTIASAVLVLQLTRLYTSEAAVLVHDERPQLVKVDQALPPKPVDIEAMQSEMQVIRSRSLLGSVVDKLGLVGNPLFNPLVAPKSRLAQAMAGAKAMVLDLAERIGLGTYDRSDPTATPDQIRSRAIDELLRRLEVAQEGKSHVIRLKFTSPDPQLSATVVNTIADFYVTSQLDAKLDERTRAAQWLNERLTGLKEQARAADMAVEEFRRSANLTGSAQGTPAAEQLTQLNAQLITARAERAQAEANLRQAQKLVGSSADIKDVNQVLQSPTIQQLETQDAEISRRIADLSQVYGDRHPRLVNARAELAELRAKIKREAEKVIGGMASQAAAAQAKEAALSRDVAALQAEIGRQNAASVKLRALQEEATAVRTLLNTFLARSQEVNPDRTFETTDARIISKGEVPLIPSFPKTGLLLGFAFACSLLIGAGTALGRERLDDRLRSSDQVQELGVTPLGLVPKLSGPAKSPLPAALIRPASAFAESLLNLHTALLLSNVDSPTRVVLMTSSLPDEGKTTVSVSLGRILARNGYKVLIIDCDLRRPTAHSMLGLPQGPGLTDLLLGRATQDTAFKQDPDSPAMLLSSGTTAPNPQTIIASAQMRSFLEAMRRDFDIIIIDSPPIFAVSDAKILSAIADKTVYVCRWAQTPRKNVRAGLQQLREAGADIAGVLLTAVDVGQHARYGFTDSILYQGKLKSYYAR